MDKEKEKLIEKVTDTIYNFDMGDGDWTDVYPLAKRIVSMVERRLKKDAPDLPSAVVNHCVPVNGVHAPFCTGHETANQ